VIPKDYVTEWRAQAPWVSDAQVEQDLVLSRAIVDIYRAGDLGRRLAFRGGTALYKLFLRPAARYSEDLDLVQMTAEPIGVTLDAIRAVLDPWLGEPRRQMKAGSVQVVYRFQSEELPSRALRLKVEINSREHFTEVGYARIPFDVNSRWFSGKAEVTTFELDELLGTKLRALYQRKKGRDLFDLWYALSNGGARPERIVSCFARYMREGGHAVDRATFEKNLEEKLDDKVFCADMAPLLRPGVAWDLPVAAKVVLECLLSRLGAVGPVTT
jgi:predicted nucleotidyltransferase component of viral defense system